MPKTEQQSVELRDIPHIRRALEATREFMADHGAMIMALGAIAADAYVANQRFHIVPNILHALSQAHESFFNGLQRAGRPQ